MTAPYLRLLAVLVSLLPILSSCRESPRAKSSDVVTRLCQHIVQDRKKMIVDTSQPEIVWSDGALLEIGTSFPKDLQELISHPSRQHDIRSFVNQLANRNDSDWREASVTRSSRGDRYSTIKSLDGKISTMVESLYIEYLGHRYPTASIRIRGEFEPIIFVVGDQIRGSVMPVKF